MACQELQKKKLMCHRTSSHVIRFVNCKSSTSSKSFSMLQIDDCKVGTGILSLKCFVLPPGNTKTTTSFDVTFITICRFERKVVESVFHMNVLPVPP